MPGVTGKQGLPVSVYINNGLGSIFIMQGREGNIGMLGDNGQKGQMVCCVIT